MKTKLILLITLFSLQISTAQLTVTEIGNLPESVSNNAVVEGFIEEIPYLFSFGGIDQSKIFSGIHNRSFRYNLETGEAIRLEDLPDNRGKIAAGASRIGDIIYIAGGYYVFDDESELSSNRMHRYDLVNNTYLSDGASIPIPIDDHVQVVWRDSLIYLITGWSDTENVDAVQIYNPTKDIWVSGNNLPNNNYKSFGASGSIVGDTIYYFGGATSQGAFPIQNKLRIGIINPDDPTQIDWSVSVPSALVNGYRMASTIVGDEVHWIGGSKNTYNFNGIAYDGSGGVLTSKRDLFTKRQFIGWQENLAEEIPMDLRGIAEISDTVKYIAGGMVDNQSVTSKIFKIEFNQNSTSSLEISNRQSFKISPNPTKNYLQIESEEHSDLSIQIFDQNGRLIYDNIEVDKESKINTSHWLSGIYFVKVSDMDGSNIWSQKIIKL